MDVNENIEKLIEDMRGCKNDWSRFNTKRNELFGVFLDAFQQGYKLRKILDPETTRTAPPIGRCVECAHWYKKHCAHGPCATEPTDAYFFCGSFEPKGGARMDGEQQCK